MNKATQKVVYYIFIFFLLAIFILGGYFLYNKVFQKEIVVNDIFKEDNVDKEFKKKQKEVEEYKNNLREDIKNNNNKVVEKKNCISNGKEYPHGSWTSFYSKRFVVLYEGCSKYETKKRCDDGIWMGDSFYKEEKCSKSVNCELENGKEMKNGETKNFYFFSEVPFGKKCEDYVIKRTCNNTYLKGDSRYKYTECKVVDDGICKIDGNILPNQKSHLFYSRNEVAYNEKCQDFSKLRICTNGILYGEKKYKYWDCNIEIAKKCMTDGQEFEHGQLVLLYSKRSGGDKGCKFYSQYRKCINGNFDNQPEFSYVSCLE